MLFEDSGPDDHEADGAAIETGLPACASDLCPYRGIKYCGIVPLADGALIAKGEEQTIRSARHGGRVAFVGVRT